LGVSLDDVRQKVAARQLVFDPSSRRLVEVTDRKLLSEEVNEANKERVENQTDLSPDTSMGADDQVPEEYLSIGDAARELGEPVISILDRIGKKDLETKLVRGKVMIRRQAIVTLKHSVDPIPSKRPEVTEPEAGPNRSAIQKGSPDTEGVAQNQHSASDERKRTDEPEKSSHHRATAQNQIRLLQDELAKLRTQLAAEATRRSNSEQHVRELRRELEESNAREKRVLELLSNTQKELAKAKETIGFPEVKDRLLSSIRRRLSSEER
jgi:hypothetical protein